MTITIPLFPHGWITCGTHYLRKQAHNYVLYVSYIVLFFLKVPHGLILTGNEKKNEKKNKNEKRQHKHKPVWKINQFFLNS